MFRRQELLDSIRQKERTSIICASRHFGRNASTYIQPETPELEPPSARSWLKCGLERRRHDKGGAGIASSVGVGSDLSNGNVL